MSFIVAETVKDTVLPDLPLNVKLKVPVDPLTLLHFQIRELGPVSFYDEVTSGTNFH